MFEYDFWCHSLRFEYFNNRSICQYSLMTSSLSHKIYRPLIHGDLVGYAREGKGASNKLSNKE